MPKNNKIKIKRVYDPIEKNDGFRILVDRIWPRGISKVNAKLDLWLKNIAPSAELRKWYNHDSSKWRKFQIKYEKEILNNKNEMNSLRAFIKEYPHITLIYAAADRGHNNAVVLKEVLKNSK